MSGVNSSILAASEAVFGSSARGDGDRLSDRDILIVDDDLEVLRARSRELAAEGWSVASYTFAKLNALTKNGALFIQHLKQECQIIADRRGALAEILSDYRPKPCYRIELEANAKLAQLMSTVPLVPRGELWAADVLYVTVRNFGVLWLAGTQRYVFAFDDILSSLEEARVIGPTAASDLRYLRFLKCLYRNGESLPEGRFQETISRSLDSLPAEFFPQATRRLSSLQILCESPPHHGAANYLILRDLEKRLLAAYSLLTPSFTDPLFNRLQAWIENPRAYANLSARKAPELRSLLGKVGTGERPLKFLNRVISQVIAG